MPHIRLFIDEETDGLIRDLAKTAGFSKSRTCEASLAVWARTQAAQSWAVKIRASKEGLEEALINEGINATRDPNHELNGGVVSPYWADSVVEVSDHDTDQDKAPPPGVTLEEQGRVYNWSEMILTHYTKEGHKRFGILPEHLNCGSITNMYPELMKELEVELQLTDDFVVSPKTLGEISKECHKANLALSSKEWSDYLILIESVEQDMLELP